MLLPLIRSKRNAAYVGLSMPVTQIRDLTGAVDDRIAGLDRDNGLQLVVPDVVDLILGKVMRLGHAANLLVVPCPDHTLSVYGISFSRLEKESIRSDGGIEYGVQEEVAF
jgi:hypothetical protein